MVVNVQAAVLFTMASELPECHERNSTTYCGNHI